MSMAQKRWWRRILPAMLLMATGGMLSVSCGKKTTSEQEQANQKRWESFQNDNKRDMAVGMSAYERRQAQLAAKKQKGAEGKPGAKPDAAPPGPDSPVKKTAD